MSVVGGRETPLGVCKNAVGVARVPLGWGARARASASGRGVPRVTVLLLQSLLSLLSSLLLALLLHEPEKI